MKLIKLLIGLHCMIIFLIIESFALHAQPIIPYIEKDICPSECCQYGQWKAKSNLKVYKNEGDSSEVTYTIRPGEKFTAVRGNVHIVKVGIIVVNEPFTFKSKSFKTIFKHGDRIYILSYIGEGAYSLWYKDKMLDTDLDDSDKIWENCKVVQQPHMIWWILVKNKEGKQGWLKRDIGDGMSEREETIELMMKTCGK